MTITDWRELYASNRAAIEAAGVGTLGQPPALRPHRPRRAQGRDVVVHVPGGLDTRTPVPVVCLLHGCTQDAASFAAATRIHAAADRHGFVVVLPQQGQGENPQGCWNWFLPAHQARGAGEPAWIVRGIREAVAAAGVTADARRVFVAGLSAGGAMAAILARAYPEVFAAAAVHSGLAAGSATDVGSAFAAMARGAAGSGTPRGGPPVPTVVVHGTADQTVAPVNAEHVLRDAMAGSGLQPTRPTATSREEGGGRAFTRSRWWRGDGTPAYELLLVEGLGHAWSGGAPGGSFADPRGPDATAAILRFFADVTARREGDARGRLGRPAAR